MIHTYGNGLAAANNQPAETPTKYATNSIAITTSDASDLFAAYIEHGWVLTAIPPNSKGPKTIGWNKRENALAADSVLPEGYGVGLCHAYSGTAALDIDDWEAAEGLLKSHNIDLIALYGALDAVTISSGRVGRGKLIYAMPFGLTLPSKKINYTASDGSKQVAYELRCATADGLTVQDVLPSAGLHPLTQQPYKWGGRGRWQELPMIPMELLTLWTDLLGTPSTQVSEKTTATDDLSVSWDEIESALSVINPECSRDDWLNCMMALHYAGITTGQEAHAFQVADDWSSQAPTKYKGKQDIVSTWKSFREHPDGVKLGTLFHIAAEHGLRRPSPDVQEMFSELIPSVPEANPFRFKLLSGIDLRELQPLKWVVRGVLPAVGLAGLYGPSSSGKSFLALDLAAAIAEGWQP